MNKSITMFSILIISILMICLQFSSLFSQTSITFTFANGQIIGTALYKFDVMAQAGDPGTGIGDTKVFLNYNPLAFGQNIETNGKINVTKGSLISNPLYTISVSDDSSSRVEIASNWPLDGNPFGTELPTSPTQLLHVEIEIADASESSGISFEQSLMVGQQFQDWYDPGFPNPIYVYSPVIATDTYDTPLPVELSNFFATVSISKEAVRLAWTTELETNNLGFEVWRSNSQNDQYDMMASYKNHPELEGHGNTGIQHKYTYWDDLIVDGRTYWYKLYDVDHNGNRTEHGPVSVTVKFDGLTLVSPISPGDYNLFQNFPNPFNPSTTIQFDIPYIQEGTVNGSLIVYNALGQKIKNLYSGEMSSGSFQIQWDGKNENGVRVPSGVYLYRIQAGYFVQTKKMILIN